MSLFTKLVAVVHSWRRRRVGMNPSRKRTGPTLEQLDHRQLLAVNFTGVAATDFPATESPGVQVITNPSTANGGTNTYPGIPPALANVISVSGFQINDLRVSYTQADDTLNIGVEGPNNGRDANQVIAADSDNNGNSGTVNPSVTAIDQQFMDPADMGGTKTYGVSLAFNNTGIPDVVAGFPTGNQNDTAAKPYEVARAITQTTNSALPQFDQTQIYPQYTGNYYLANDPTRPNFELQITHFSQLYQQITGNAFTSTSPLEIGGFGTSDQDGGISDEVDPPLPVNFAQATVPTPTPTPTPTPIPMAPTVYVNPHAANHVNTAHNTAVRVSVLGSSGFDPTTIIPSTVRFGNPATIATNGATPILNFEHNVNHDGYPDETFIFDGLNVVLPPGITTAEITGTTTSGQTFASSVQVFNRDASYYTPAQISRQAAKFARYDAANGIDTTNGVVSPPVRVPKLAEQRAASAAINDLYNPFAGKKVPVEVNPGATNAQGSTSVTTASVKTISAASVGTPTPVTVSIPTKHSKAVGQTVKIPKATKSAKKASVISDLFTNPLNLVSGA